MKAQTISFVSNKGGTGKTTVSIFTANILTKINKKCLLIDCDRENNSLSVYYDKLIKPEITNIDPQNLHQEILNKNINNVFKKTYELLLSTGKEIETLSLQDYTKNKKLIEEAEREQDTKITEILQNNIIKINEKIDLIHGVADLQPISINNTNCLKKSLQTVEKEYDYIIIDTTPTLDSITENVMQASHHIVIPVILNTFNEQSNVKMIKDYPNMTNKMKMVINHYIKPRANSVNSYDEEILNLFKKNLYLKNYIMDNKISKSINIQKYVDITGYQIRNNQKTNKIFDEIKRYIIELLVDNLKKNDQDAIKQLKLI